MKTKTLLKNIVRWPWKTIAIVVAVALLALGTVFGFPALVPFLAGKHSKEEWQHFAHVGETYVALHAWADTAALLLLIITVYYHGKELAHHSNALAHQELQSALVPFFSLFRDFVTSLSGPYQTQGRAAIQKWRNEFEMRYNDKKKQSVGTPLERQRTSDIQKKWAAEAFDELYGSSGSQLSQYFRHIANMLKIIKHSLCSPRVKDDFVDMIRTQLSPEEMALIAYNNLSKHSGSLRALLDEFDIFGSMREERGWLLDDAHSEFLLPKRAQD